MWEISQVAEGYHQKGPVVEAFTTGREKSGRW